MADNKLLLVTIPEDTRKSEPIYKPKKKLKTLLWYDFFLPDLGRNISGFGLSLQNRTTEPL